MHPPSKPLSLGLIGFGAFGRLMARHLAPPAEIVAHDPAWPGGPVDGVRCGSLAEAAVRDVVVLAVPVSRTEGVARAIAPHLRAGALVLDVGSVKVEPAAALLRVLPGHVDILATHPLFGPESARDGLAGQKIVLCPLRGRRLRPVSGFLRRRLGLRVIVASPEAHDRELATVQGLTHMVARLVAGMGSLPTRLTTRSFDQLVAAVALVAGDAPEVFDAILRGNPHAAAVRARFFGAAAKLEAELAAPRPGATQALTAPSPCSAMLPRWSSAPESAPSWCP